MGQVCFPGPIALRYIQNCFPWIPPASARSAAATFRRARLPAPVAPRSPTVIACSGVLLWRCWCGTRTARALALHGRPQNPVDARLVAPALGFKPIQYIGVKAYGQLLFRGGPCFPCLRKERLVEPRDVGIVDLGVLHAVNPRQVAFDRFFAHVDLPFSWR